MSKEKSRRKELKKKPLMTAKEKKVLKKVKKSEQQSGLQIKIGSLEKRVKI